MKKLILTEKQYKRLQNILVDSVINEGFINESSKTNQYSNTLIFEENNPQILSEGEYELKKFNKLNKEGSARKALAKGVVFKPSEKTAGYLVAKPQTLYKSTGISSWEKIPNKTVIYNCSKGKFHIQGEKGFYDYDLYNEDLSKALKPLCSESITKNNLPKTYGTEAVGGGLGYTQKHDQPITSQDGKKITIPKGTGYTPKKDGAGLSFKVGNDFGWFDCNTKNFVINKVKYTNDTLSKTLSTQFCKVTPQNDVTTPVVAGGGGATTPASGGGGAQPTTLPPDLDLYI